jgi:hypothetical protein
MINNYDNLDIEEDLENMKEQLNDMDIDDAYAMLELYQMLAEKNNISVYEYFRYIWAFMECGIC